MDVLLLTHTHTVDQSIRNSVRYRCKHYGVKWTNSETLQASMTACIPRALHDCMHIPRLHAHYSLAAHCISHDYGCMHSHHMTACTYSGSGDIRWSVLFSAVCGGASRRKVSGEVTLILWSSHCLWHKRCLENTPNTEHTHTQSSFWVTSNFQLCMQNKVNLHSAGLQPVLCFYVENAGVKVTHNIPSPSLRFRVHKLITHTREHIH